MQEKLKTLDFNFENCESGTVPLDAIKYLSLDGISKKTSISLNAMLDKPQLDQEEYLACESFDIILDLESVKHLATNFFTDSKTSQNPLLTHLVTWPDIVDINLNYENGKTLNIYMPWKSFKPNDLDTNNLYQVKNVFKTKLEITIDSELKTNYGM